jgi:hypothetical protein
LTDLSKVSRVEVIEPTSGGGRRYVRYAVKAEISIQDDGRTLKIFVFPRAGGEFPVPTAGHFVIDANNPPRGWWPLGRIFRGIRQQWRSVRIDDFMADLRGERRFQEAYGMILCACVSEQVAFLAALYEQHFPDEDVQMALRSLCKNGKMIEMMNPETGAPLLHAAYNAIMEARGKM